MRLGLVQAHSAKGGKRWKKGGKFPKKGGKIRQNKSPALLPAERGYFMRNSLFSLTFELDSEKFDVDSFLKANSFIEDFIYCVHKTDKSLHCHCLIDFGKKNFYLEIVSAWYSYLKNSSVKPIKRSSLIYEIFYITNCRDVACKVLEIRSTKGFEVF